MADTFSKDEQQAWNRMAAASSDKPVANNDNEASSQPAAEEIPAVESEPVEVPFEEEDERQPQGMVPHAALNEERSRRQQLEQDNRRLAEERALFDGRLQAVLAMQQQRSEPPPPPEPDEMTDPIGTIKTLRERLNRMEQANQQQNEYLQRQQWQKQLYDAANYDAARFRYQQQPDYDNAFNYWQQARAYELRNYGVDDQGIRRTLSQEQMAIAAAAFQQGRSPAEMLYRVAQSRGYQAQAHAGNGAGAGPYTNGDAQVSRINQGQSRSRTLSGTGGGSTPTAMTADQLLKMSEAEFDAWTTKNPTATKRLLGGG